MRSIELYMRSGNHIVLPLDDGADVTWEHQGGKLTQINTPAIPGASGIFLDVTQIEFFIIHKD